MMAGELIQRITEPCFKIEIYIRRVEHKTWSGNTSTIWLGFASWSLSDLYVSSLLPWSVWSETKCHCYLNNSRRTVIGRLNTANTYIKKFQVPASLNFLIICKSKIIFNNIIQVFIHVVVPDILFFLVGTYFYKWECHLALHHAITVHFKCKQKLFIKSEI